MNTPNEDSKGVLVNVENVRIYLQGKFAIGKFEIKGESVDLAVGTPDSKIAITDHRPNTISQLNNILSGQADQNSFANAFNQPGLIRVYLRLPANEVHIDIYIEDPKLPIPEHTLYLGVIWDHTFQL